MKKFLQDGHVVTLTAPAGGVTVDAPVLIGQMLVVPTHSAVAGAKFTGVIRGIFSVTKVGSQAWAEGACVYWDAANSRFTTVATGNHPAGWAMEVVGAGAGETTGVVFLDGVARATEGV